ncbi:MAG: hypothetical protein ACXABI_17820, partial [Candidatus Hodarchaeales archaeon]
MMSYQPIFMRVNPFYINRSILKASTSPLLVTIVTISLIIFPLSFVGQDSNAIPTSNSTLSDYSSCSIPIVQLYQDAKYAYDKMQLRQDIYNPNQTGFYFSTEVIENRNYTVTNNLGHSTIFYVMYKMTNDSNYLDLARNLFLNILKYCSGQINVSNTIYNSIVSYDWKNDIILDSSFSPLGIFLPIA